MYRFLNYVADEQHSDKLLIQYTISPATATLAQSNTVPRLRLRAVMMPHDSRHCATRGPSSRHTRARRSRLIGAVRPPPFTCPAYRAAPADGTNGNHADELPCIRLASVS